MVGLIDDDGPEVIFGKLLQSGIPGQCLDGSNHYSVPAVQATLLGLFSGRQEPCGLGQLIGRLIQQLPTVSQDKRPVTLFYSLFNNFGEYYCLAGLAAPRWKNQQGALNAFFPFVQYGCFRCFLIWAKLHN